MIPEIEPPSLIASLGQERHWNYQSKYPQSAAFNVPIAAWFSGPIDVGALEEAFRRVGDRHESLSSSFRAGSRNLQMVPHSAKTLHVDVHDLRSIGSDLDKVQALATIGTTAAARPFDLGSELASRLELVRIQNEETILILNAHHISFDGWSSPLFFAEMADQYESIKMGSTSRRANPERRYADFARWQRQVLKTGGFDDGVAYWKESLTHRVEPSSWPVEGAVPELDWWTGDMTWHELPEQLVASAMHSARSMRTTFFVWALSVYQVALAQFLGDWSVAVGTPFTARTDRRWDDVIGFFVNTVALARELEPDQSFSELIRETHEWATRAHQNQSVPLGLVIDALDVPATPLRTPIFQSMFILQNTPMPSAAFSATRLKTTKLVTGSARYDMTFSLGWRNGRLALELENRPALLSTEAANRFASIYLGVLAASVNDPSKKLEQMVPENLSIHAHRHVDLSSGLAGMFEGIVGDWRA